MGDFPAAEREARKVLEVNPSYEKAYRGLAYAQVGQGQIAEAIKTYQQLEKVSNVGESSAASGLADIALYEGRLGDAVQLLQRGAAVDLKAGRTDSAAADLALLGNALFLRNQKAAALAALDKALANSKSISTRFLTARVYAAAGETAKARSLAATLASESQPEPQAYAKLIEGEAALQDKDPRKAIALFSEANKLLDSWIGHFDLGRAYLETDSFVEADSEFDQCIARRGESLDLFDFVPTYAYIPPVYYYLGRTEEGLRSSGAANSYWKFVSIQEKGDGGTMLEDAKKRIDELNKR
jgi:tetratricopeptide (TPR) repeat protein